LGFDKGTATFNALATSLVLVDEEDFGFADFKTVLEGCTFEVVIQEGGCATDAQECQPADDEFRLVRKVQCDELAWLDFL
jgi:hypothetical protein